MKLNMQVMVLLGLAAMAGVAAAANVDPLVQQALARPASVEKGKIVYETCRGCHKADASGRPDAGYPQLAGQHKSVLIKQMMDTRAGRRDNPRMHPFIEAGAVEDREIPHIAAYLNSLPVPQTNRKGDGKNLTKGEALYRKDCADCHGMAGEGDAAHFNPRISGQHYPYLFRESIDIRDGQRKNSNKEMVRILKPYSDEDIEAVSDYMSRMGQ